MGTEEAQRVQDSNAIQIIEGILPTYKIEINVFEYTL